VLVLGGIVGIWKHARKLVILSELKSTGHLILPADKLTQGNIPLGLMQASLRFCLSQMPQGRSTKTKEKKLDLETSLLAVEVIKLGTQP
jgi:hypothetical protein